jgi:sterol desaturase/sphingolipid hydroxylase (fatty acid hydroxylase superfamily)
VSVKVWKQFTPFYFYTTICLFLGIVSATGKGLSKTYVAILLILGFLSWGIVEYVMHRFIFHLDARSRLELNLMNAAHRSHHENPRATDQLFASMKVSVPVAASYWLVAWAALGTWRAASYLFMGLIAGYFCYEWLHFQAHHWTPRLSVFRYLKKYHLLHHYRTPSFRFGVTSPLFDLLFGTFRRVGDTSSTVEGRTS